MYTTFKETVSEDDIPGFWIKTSGPADSKDIDYYMSNKKVLDNNNVYCPGYIVYEGDAKETANVCEQAAQEAVDKKWLYLNSSSNAREIFNALCQTGNNDFNKRQII